ncbi:hypothetical protein GH714_039575 [Hevea brasiliensis]|uniref:Helicase C-terminal domain-containing protein n=1 Tax=Hevea brasiliensis TaxID=3981 RepID=A0A6A6MX59_HEVBR|nr:hypothetical protein GH714_039575 [Hevea brasiliensis]
MLIFTLCPFISVMWKQNLSPFEFITGRACQEAAALHSFKSQSLRLSAVHRFKSGQSSVLIATDVASRGLDIPTVDLVINYDIPRYPRDYVHRVGRTARAGRGGLAVSFVTENDVDLIHEIEAVLGKQLVEFECKEKEASQILLSLKTADAKCFVVVRGVTGNESATLKTFLDDNTETSSIKAPEEARKEYDADFVKELNNKQTRELILAVNYLDIKEFAGCV